ncbi:MAG: hypothetical protein QM779_04855 [Propionicimonas sp.]|uniref:zonular occludens toxin domain-containing protein n=1 Tax=Propionicimonas sp. TaxID=1955623 RepID=UPI003D102939
MSDRIVTALVKRQRAYPVRAYVGPNGGGKTASAVASVLPSLAAGRPVVSNIRILDWQDPRPCDDPACECVKDDPDRHRAAHPLWRPLRTWKDVVDARSCDILCDEISTMLSSRDTGGLPGEVEGFLQQPRKPDVCFIWTAPAWARSDKIMREVTRLVVFNRGVKLFSHVRDQGDRMWVENRLFRTSGYDAMELEAFENGKRDNVPMMWQGMWWGPGSPRFRAYDTYEYVQLLGARANRGPCLECGMKRQSSTATCKGHDEPDEQESAPRRAAADTVPETKKGPRGNGGRTTNNSFSFEGLRIVDGSSQRS